MAESKLGTAYVAIRATLDKLDDDLKTAREKVEKGLSGALDKVGKSMVTTGATLTAAVTAPILGLGAAVLSVGGQFDEAMDTIRTTTGATGATLTGLGEDVKAVFGAIPTDMATAATAIADLNARTGQTGKGLQELAQAEIELARITGGELSSQIQNSTRMFGDWGIAVTDQVPALDALLRAHQATGIGVDSLAAKLVQFGAPLRQMGFDFETSAALIGKFEKEGVNTELVLGSLRIALGKMAKAGIEPKEGLQALVEEIKNTGSTAEANSLAIAAFGARAGPDMAAAIREGRFDLGELYKQIANGSETVKKAAADTGDYAEQFTVLKNKVMLAALPLGVTLFGAINNLMPLLERVIGFVAGLIEKFSNLPVGVQTGILAFLGVIAAIGPVVTVIGGLITGIGAISTAFAAVGAFMATAVAPIVAAILPIALPILAIIAVLVLLYSAWTNNWGGIRDKVMEIVPQIGAFLGTAWETIKAAAITAWTAISAFFTTTWTNISTTATTIWTAIGAFFTTIMTLVANAITTTWDVIRATVTAVWTVIQAVATAIWQAISLMIETTLTVLAGVITAVLQVMQGNFAGAWETIKTTATTAFTGLRDGVVGILNGLVAAAASAGTGMMTAFRDAIVSRANAALDAVRAIVAQIRNLLPGSDAEMGPLSDLTASGRALPATLAAGIMANAGAVRNAAMAMAAGAQTTLGGMMMAPPGPGAAPGLGAGGRGQGAGGTTGQAVSVTINNPRGEPSETSLVKQLRNLAYLGVLEPVGAMA